MSEEEGCKRQSDGLMVCPHLVIHMESDLLFTSVASVKVGIAKVDQPGEHLIEISHGALQSKLTVADAKFLPSHAGQCMALPGNLRTD